MKRASTLLILVVLIACDKKLKQYKEVITEANKAEVYYMRTGKIILLSKTDLASFKNVFTRDIEPAAPQRFVGYTRVNLYKDDQKTATLTIGDSPCVNFTSGSLNFSFRLTYGIGMFADELFQEHLR